ncbi:hypothetical protein Tco_0565781 [Tanacetum coccineum]
MEGNSEMVNSKEVGIFIWNAIGVVRVLSPVTAAEIQAVEKERKAKNILLMAISQNSCTLSTSSTNIPEKEVLAGFADEVIYSLLPNNKRFWTLLLEVLEQIDDVDIEDYQGDTWWERRRETHFIQHQEAGLAEKNQDGLLTMDDGIVNWGEHTEAEEINHALYGYSSSNEKLEAQLVTSQKQQLSLNEKLAFQANEIHEKDEKLKRYRRIGMKGTVNANGPQGRPKPAKAWVNKDQLEEFEEVNGGSVTFGW